MTAAQIKASDDKAKAAPPPTPKTTEKPLDTGAGAKANLKAAKTSRDGAKATTASKAETPATKKAEKAPPKPRAPRKPKGGAACPRSEEHTSDLPSLMRTSDTVVHVKQ